MNHRDTTILIVDDSEAVGNLLADFLGQDYSCWPATSVEEARILLESRSFDLALVDIRMPGLTDIRMWREIAESSACMRLVVISSLTDLDQVVEAMRKGAVDYIRKPFDLLQVSLAVKHALTAGLRPAVEIVRQQPCLA